MRVLITGYSGMLGKDIVEVLSRDFNIDLFGIDKNPNENLSLEKQYTGDLLNSSFVSKSLSDINPDVIIHCAAIVNIALCEEDKELAKYLHVDVTNWLSSYNSKKFIYISTDSIFNGEKGDYSEEDTPEPLNYYAKSKLEGEYIALKNNPNTVVCRTNIYGFTYSGGNSLAEWALSNIKQGERTQGFSDVLFNPLYTKQLADFISKILYKDSFSGIINVGSNDFISKFEFIIKLAEEFNLPLNMIDKTSINKYESKIQRPKNTTLNCSKLRNTFGIEYLFKKGLKEFKKDYLDNEDKNWG